MTVFNSRVGVQAREWADDELNPPAGSPVARSLVLALFAPLALLARPAVRRFLLMVLLLDVPLQVGMHLWNREAAGEMGSLSGLNLSATTVALALLYLSSAIEYLGSHDRRRPALRYSLPLCVYVAIAVISSLFARDLSLSAFELFLFAQTLLLFLYVANWVRSGEDLLFVVNLLLAGFVIESLLMLWLAYRGSGFDLVGMSARLDVDMLDGGLPRVGGSVGGPNGAGAYLAVMLGVAAGVLMSGATLRNKLLAGCGFALGVMALLTTYSRGGWTATAVAVGLVGFVTLRSRPQARKWIAAAVIILCLALAIKHSAVSARLFSDDHDAAYSRVPLLTIAYRIIADHPILGVGANNYASVMDNYISGEFISGFVYTVHNRYLLIWAETGTLGLLAYLWFLLSTLRQGWRCWKVGDNLLSPIALGLTAALAGHMVHMNLEAFRGRPLTQLPWLLAALIAAMHASPPQRNRLPIVPWTSQLS